MRSSIVVLLTTITMTGFTARASVAQANPREPLLRGASFLLLKYASTHTMALYGAYGRGPAIGLVGLVWNPRSGNEQALIGCGTRLRLGARAGLTMLAAIAGGSDGSMLRFYALPQVRKGGVTLGATATTSVPLGGDRRWRAAVDPLLLSFRATRALSVGVAGVVRARADRATAVGGGPVSAVHVAGVTVRGELVVLSTGAEARVVTGVAF